MNCPVRQLAVYCHVAAGIFFPDERRGGIPGNQDVVYRSDVAGRGPRNGQSRRIGRSAGIGRSSGKGLDGLTVRTMSSPPNRTFTSYASMLPSPVIGSKRHGRCNADGSNKPPIPRASDIEDTPRNARIAHLGVERHIDDTTVKSDVVPTPDNARRDDTTVHVALGAHIYSEVVPRGWMPS